MPKPGKDRDSKPPKGKDSPRGGGPKKDKIDRDQIEEEYGLSYSLFKAFPELDKLLKQAVAGSWTPNKFQVELRQTDWFKKHSDVWRENTALFHSDPATFNERFENTLSMVQNMMGSVGASLGDKAARRLAKRALLFGMSEDEIYNTLAGHVKPSAGHYTGDLSSIESSLRQTALQNGVVVGDDQLKKWMQSIVRGDASEDQFQTNIRDLAAKAFPLYGEQIKGGMDLIDVAQPYLQSMSTILELPVGGIDLADPTIRKALSGVAGTNGQLNPLNIADFETQLRNDPRWSFTRNAKDQAKGFAASIAKMWGLS